MKSFRNIMGDSQNLDKRIQKIKQNVTKYKKPIIRLFFYAPVTIVIIHTHISCNGAMFSFCEMPISAYDFTKYASHLHKDRD